MAQSKTNTPAAPAPRKRINWETIKTITIAVLITGIVAFVAGAYTMHQYDSKTAAAVKAAQTTVASPAPSK